MFYAYTVLLRAKGPPRLGPFPQVCDTDTKLSLRHLHWKESGFGRRIRSNLYLKNVSTTSSPVLSKFGNLEHLFISSGYKLQVFESRKTVTLETRYIFNGFVTECHDRNT